MFGSKTEQLHKRRLNNFKQKKGLPTVTGPNEQQQFLDLYMQTMTKNHIGPRVGKNEK